MPEYSGSGLRAHNTYKRLKNKYGIKYDVVANSIEFNDNREYIYDSVKVVRLGKQIQNLIQYNNLFSKGIYHSIDFMNYILLAGKTKKILQSDNYDLIHSFGSSYTISYAMQWAKKKHIPFIRELCNTGAMPYPSYPLFLRLFSNNKFPARFKVIAISGDMYQNALKSNIDPDIIWHRPNPIDIKRFKPCWSGKRSLRSSLTNFHKHDKVIVNIAKFMPTKKQILLVRVLSLLPENYKLLLAGPIVSDGENASRDTKYFSEIKDEINKMNLESRVQIKAEFIHDVEKYYQLSDIFAFPTTLEALGTPMLEAIACGIPAVTSIIPGVTDQWVVDGKNGYLSELTPEAFAQKIQMAAEIPQEQLLKSSRAIHEKASEDVIDRGYIDIINDLVGKR